MRCRNTLRGGNELGRSWTLCTLPSTRFFSSIFSSRELVSGRVHRSKPLYLHCWPKKPTHGRLSLRDYYRSLSCSKVRSRWARRASTRSLLFSRIWIDTRPGETPTETVSSAGIVVRQATSSQSVTSWSVTSRRMIRARRLIVQRRW